MEPVVEDHSTAHRQVVRLTGAQLDRLVEGYLAGKSYELGRQFGIARQTVSGHLYRHGVPMRMRGLDDALRSEITRLRDEDWSLKRLGDRFGVDASTVRNFLLRATLAAK
ncbi:MAG: helix-turn-helix domain-containing protein [Propionibacteriaceae bacterium]|nr:helix-turn-helix domain-containing protein [Propionibacteriaceae bacterium]